MRKNLKRFYNINISWSTVNYTLVSARKKILGKIKFLWYSWRMTDRKAFGILFGVVPEHQGKGVDGAIIEAFRVLMQEKYKRYNEFEMNWIGDFNIKMIRVCEQINPAIVKRHATYRKLFDESKPFKRYPIKL